VIERFMFVKLASGFSNEQVRTELAAEAHRVISAVPGVLEVSAGVPADDHATVWDLSIRVRFGSYEAVTAYVADPGHRQWVDDRLRPRAEVIKFWNFRIAPTG
jgi:antibiotic biosynthesis monooxygenase (ABM) superfamily enzyme